jgi:hypothetical protein
MTDKAFWQAASPLSVLEHVEQAVLGDTVMVSLLQHHGCVIHGTSILFPAGTVAQHIEPRWGWMHTSHIRLPNGVELSWRLDHSREPAGSVLQVSRALYQQERYLLICEQRASNEQESVMTLQATRQEVVALGMAIHSYRMLLERQPSVTQEQQKVLELVGRVHDRFVASLPSRMK